LSPDERIRGVHKIIFVDGYPVLNGREKENEKRGKEERRGEERRGEEPTEGEEGCTGMV
jgi:hypothetical protein